MNGYTPTTEQVRTEWVESAANPSETNRLHSNAEFDRWIEAHDRQVAEKALRDWADLQERTLENFAYVADDCDRAETAQWCKAIRLYADRIATGQVEK